MVKIEVRDVSSDSVALLEEKQKRAKLIDLFLRHLPAKIRGMNKRRKKVAIAKKLHKLMEKPYGKVYLYSPVGPSDS